MVTASYHSPSLFTSPPLTEQVTLLCGPQNIKIFFLCVLFFPADSPSDYTSLSGAEARFPPCTDERCVDIVTINDDLVEGDEDFYVSVTRDSYWDSRLRLTRSRSLFTIEDDDSECRMLILSCTSFLLTHSSCTSYY